MITENDIIVLAKEAKLLYPYDDSTTSLYVEGSDISPYIFKFAELIINECAKTCEEHPSTWGKMFSKLLKESLNNVSS